MPVPKCGVASLFSAGCIALILLPCSVAATTLTATISADEGFKAYISRSSQANGDLFLEASGGTPVSGMFDLVDGVVQYLHIAVKNDSQDVSSLVGTFTLSDVDFIFPNLGSSISTDADHWKVFTEDIGANLDILLDLGLNGTSPWGVQAGISFDARHIWSESLSGERYFSLPILPTASLSGQFAHTVTTSLFPWESFDENQILPVHYSYLDGISKAVTIVDPGRTAGLVEESLLEGAGDRYTQASARFESHDFIITTEGVETTVDASLNLHLKGVMEGGAGVGIIASEISRSSNMITVFYQVADEVLRAGEVTITAWEEPGAGRPGSGLHKLEGGFLNGVFPEDISSDTGEFKFEFHMPIDHMATSPTYSLAVGVPFKLRLDLILTSQASNNDVGKAYSSLNFSGGWSFPVSGDVFNLPEGFTVNSINGNVVDNRFEGDASVPFAEGMFLQLPDVIGDSQAEGHEDWIDLTSVSSGISRTRGGYRAIAPLLGDFVVTKHIDKSSPKLAEALSDGRWFDDVVIEYNQVLSGDQFSSFLYRINGAIINEYQLVGGLEDLVPREEVSFNYDYVDWVYRLLDGEGNNQVEVNAWWDVSTEQGGSGSKSGENNPPSADPVGNQSVGSGDVGSFDILINDMDTSQENLSVTVSASRPDLIGELVVTGTGANRQVSYKTSALRSGFSSILLTVSDGVDSRTTSIPVLIDVEMTPFEGFLAAYFTEEEMFNPQIASPILDPDKDGILTVIEYLLGTNPTEFNRSSEALEVVFDSDSGECKLTLDFKKRLDDPNVQGYIWASRNMIDWERMDSENPMYEESGQSGQNPLFEETTATIVFPDACKEPIFIRYQVQDVF